MSDKPNYRDFKAAFVCKEFGLLDILEVQAF